MSTETSIGDRGSTNSCLMAETTNWVKAEDWAVAEYEEAILYSRVDDRRSIGFVYE